MKFFSVFLCQRCREIWREILVKFSVLRFPGFGCTTENFTKSSRQKRCFKTENFTQIALRWGAALMLLAQKIVITTDFFCKSAVSWGENAFGQKKVHGGAMPLSRIKKSLKGRKGTSAKKMTILAEAITRSFLGNLYFVIIFVLPCQPVPPKFRGCHFVLNFFGWSVRNPLFYDVFWGPPPKFRG